MKKALLFMLLFPAMAVAQRDWANMQISHTELAPGIHRLFVGDIVTVVAFTGADGLMLIDAAYEQTTSQLIDTLKSISPHPVRFLVNTHLHSDHTGGNIGLGKNATIIAHQSVKKWLESDRKQGERIPGPMPAHAIPNFTFDSTLNIEFNGESVQMFHLPGGHTAGDIIVYFSESDVLVLGDLLFAGYFPFVDINQGGHPHVYISHLNWIINHFPESAIVVGGHGPVYNMKQLKNWLSNLEETIRVISESKKQGITAGEMKEKRILQKWDSYGTFFISADRWIDTVYPYVGD